MAHESIFAQVLRLAREKREAMPEHRAFQHTEQLPCTQLGAQEFTWKEKEDEQ
jgi:hypothetical protein